MPVQSPSTKKSSIVHRSESLRSEVSDASQQSKRVSFNRDVHVKRIPRGTTVDRNGKLVAVLDGSSSSASGGGLGSRNSDTSSPNGRLWVNSLVPSKEALPEEELLREAQTILKHVDSVTCSTSGTLERSKSSGNTIKHKAIKVQKSPSRLSDFFSKTLPSHLKNKYQHSKSTQNLVSNPDPNSLHNGNGVVNFNGNKNGSKNELRQSVSRQLSNNSSLNSSISKSEPNLYTNGGGGYNIHSNGNGNLRYKKVAKIKKPHGNRVALNSIGETPTNSTESSSNSGSGSENNNHHSKNKVSTSDSPVSSLSGPEENIMANSLGRDYSNNNHQNRVSSIVQQLSSRRGQESPERNLNSYRSPIIDPILTGNTHNNNKPFSYITGNNSSNNNHIERGQSPGKNPSTTTSPSPPTPTGKILPKEVIYAQVVCSGKGEPGVPGEKRTVHTTVTNGAIDSRSSPPRIKTNELLNNKTSNSNKINGSSSSVSPNSIQHFFYGNNHQNKEDTTTKPRKLTNGLKTSSSMNDHNSFRTGYHRPSYDDFDFSGAKPRNNVTTVLLNNVDDDDTSFSSSRNNSYNYNSSNYRNHSPSPSPNYRRPEQTFYFGSPRLSNHNTESNHHSSPLNNNNHYSSSSFNYKSPRIHHHDYPSSREVSPAAKAVSSALLVRDAERKKDSIVSSAKLVSTFGHHHGGGGGGHVNNIDYDYNKLDHDTSRRESPNRINSRIPNGHSTSTLPKSKYGLSSSMEHSNHLHQHDHLSSKSNKKIKIIGGSKTSTPNASNSSVNKLGLRSKENSPTYREFSKSKSPEKITTSSSGTLKRGGDSSLERKYNRKNKEEQSTETKTSTTTTTGGNGIISTLMRRNKEKKIQKEAAKEKERKEMAENSSPENQGSKENKIKRQRAKFLSAFLDKNFPSRNKNTEANTTTTTTTTGMTGAVDKKLLLASKNNKPTDSEIEEAERRRDGEYHSWSSGDDDYRFGHHRNGQLTRGKSYNFGELHEESGRKPWYDQNDSDYRREMATSSATLGSRPMRQMRSSGHDSDNINLRSKSLDRRAYKNRASPPRIMVTPNTPAVEETDKWKSTYDPIIRSFDRERINNGPHHHPHHHHSTLSKKMSGLSKSSYELDDPHGERGHRDSGKLRYFGDTDAEVNYEDLNYQNGTNSYLAKSHHSGHSNNKFIPRTSSYLSRGKDNYSNKYYTVPGSSLNSSGGSENGSRMSKGSSHAGSQRSVYLHAPAVADIPPTGMQGKRTLSRDELSNHSGSHKQTRHLARSMSVLAPWRPRHYREKYEVNYNNNDSKENQPYGRPPKPPRSPTRKSMSPSPGRAGSTESLLKSSDDKRDKSPLRSSTLGRTKDNVKISRSKSMPKDTRLFAGWLRKRRFGKEAKS